MADSGGHWLNLAEAQKLSLTNLLPGVVDEDKLRMPLAPLFPVMQARGTTTTWNRTDGTRRALRAAVGDELLNRDVESYTQMTRTLRIMYDQSLLNNYVAAVYGTINDYRATRLTELQASVWKTLNDAIVYDDGTYNSTHGEGLHAMAYAHGVLDANLSIDEGGALSIANLRTMLRAMKNGTDAFVFPFEIAQRLDAYLQESGIASWVGPGQFTFSKDDVGMRLTSFDNVPILRTDYLVAEQAATGEGSDAKAKYTSGTKEYSIFGIKFGQVVTDSPGVTLGFGQSGDDGSGLFKVVYTKDHPSYDADQLRFITYWNLLDGSRYSVARIHGITDAAVTA